MLKNWIEVHDQSRELYNINNRFKSFKTYMLRSDICDYSDACIIIKETITVESTSNGYRHNRNFILRNNAPFIPCI